MSESAQVEFKLCVDPTSFTGPLVGKVSTGLSHVGLGLGSQHALLVALVQLLLKVNGCLLEISPGSEARCSCAQSHYAFLRV